ncbi:MAG: sle, partial [Nocardioidaceae bacterium]|nr:sle [Nocardioidaceae bacterium]
RALFPDPGAFVDRHGTGPTSLSTLQTILGETRQRGWAREDGEVTPGFASVAAAVTDRHRMPVAGLAVTWPTDRGPAPDVEQVVAAVRETAQRLSRRLGGDEAT